MRRAAAAVGLPVIDADQASRHFVLPRAAVQSSTNPGQGNGCKFTGIDQPWKTPSTVKIFLGKYNMVTDNG